MYHLVFVAVQGRVSSGLHHQQTLGEISGVGEYPEEV